MSDKMLIEKKKIENCLKKLFPLCRSITGNANRKTLRVLSDITPIRIIEYKSGTEVYDWKIPKEWNINDAWIKDETGKKIVDFKISNLHVVSYSIPVHKKIKLRDLKKHIHYHDKISRAIPYRTTYYKRNWGFCVTKKEYDKIFKNIPSLEYEVCIDSTFLSNGSLTVGEVLIPGLSKKEFLISTYICHPSMANDNLSGMILTAFLAKEIKKLKNRFYSYRIIWVPETIGAIAYCYHNEKRMKLIDNGLVVSNVGGKGKFGYKESFDKENSLNLTIKNVFKKKKIQFIKYPFDINGSDERQYSSSIFKINTPIITKDKFYEYPYYHTSLDDLNFVKASNIHKSLKLYLDVIKANEKEIIYVNKKSCEPLLSKYNLYPSLGGSHIPKKKEIDQTDVILWLCNLSDGKTTITQIEKKLGLSKKYLVSMSEMLVKKGILKKIK